MCIRGCIDIDDTELMMNQNIVISQPSNNPVTTWLTCRGSFLADRSAGDANTVNELKAKEMIVVEVVRFIRLSVAADVG